MQKIARWIEEKKIAQIIFWIAYSIELAIMLIDKSALTNPWEGRLFQITFGLFVIKILLTKYERREWIAIALFTILGVVSYYYTDRNTILRIVAFVVAGKGVDIKKLIKYTFWVTLAAVIALMLLSATGVLGWNYVESDFDGQGPQGVIRRYCFGLGHPNALHCMFFSLILLAIIAYYEKISLMGIVVLFVANLTLYYFTKSKTGVLIVCIVLVLLSVIKWILVKGYCVKMCIVGVIVPAMGLLFSIANAIWGPYTFVNPEAGYWDRLDKIFTGRLSTAKVMGGIDTWSIWSNAGNTEYFDMGYSRILYWYGYVWAILAVLLMCALLWFLQKKKMYAEYIVVLTIAAYSIVEAHFVSAYIARDYALLIAMLVWPVMIEEIKKSKTDATRQEA